MSDVVASVDYELAAGFDPEAEVAREVLEDVLGDGFSREDEDYHARAWEATHGRPLKRSWQTWDEWKKYKAAFSGARPARSYHMDAASAQEALARMLNATAPEWTTHEQAEIVELCKILDRQPPDFKKPRQTAEEVQAASLKRFEKLQSEQVWTEREKAVKKENDLGALELVQMRDPREEVRAAAIERIAQLTIARS